ncbi:hypothetical protein BDZ90DRAFT_229751 [Jaminaea rosea]|uniref:uS12 prolyl 3,4-dihydroxylase n=1 Tax=Jaminaea rosea TaxID=1569628 RepID=A0A316V0J1_9BASI|nr:hypothetical protein BDZ90DRAFT_229751 [Jaminaea rosea]PWN30754.1 hypothetical protein BDZ90DRAFT_229751 [Jaminaea rosea]
MSSTADAKSNGNGTPAEEVREEIKARFAPDVLAPDTRAKVASSYSTSQPYRHAVVDGLINDELLQKARTEIIEELRFADKETDIYKVNQTGDLANLDGLEAPEAARLTSLLKVRDAMYSPEFRRWLQDVTGCGPLSAKKKDMSINDYRSGCHLLNHDDVIATRRVSYILYLPDPAHPWQPEWGGALELYPVKPAKSEGEPREPETVPSVSIPPKWNQYTFFAVQPGHSFHSVEEVCHPTASRLSISGWFHRPQSDEPGFDQADEDREEAERKEHASAAGLGAKRAAASFTPYPEGLDPPLPGSQMTQDDVDFLKPFLNPSYLAPKTQAQLFEKFGDESHILLSDIFNSKVAAAMEKGLKALDDEAGFRWWQRGKGEEGIVIPSQDAGVSKDWELIGPPHRQRYVSLRASQKPRLPSAANPTLPNTIPYEEPLELLDLLRTTVLPSPAFRHFLANISQLVPLAHRPFEARRFRPGLDYTLARADEETVLDVTFGLTPDVGRIALDAAGGPAGPTGLAAGKKRKTAAAAVSAKKAGSSQLSKKQAKDVAGKWMSGEAGGWACYMAPDDEDEGATGEVYRQGGSGAKNGDPSGEKKEEGNAAESKDGQKAEDEEGEDEEMEELDDDDADSDFDGVLLNLTPSFNTLSVALRDEGVLHFIKYLNASAGGSRWDLIGEYTVGAVEEEDEEDGEEDQKMKA